MRPAKACPPPSETPCNVNIDNSYNDNKKMKKKNILINIIMILTIII